MPFMESIDFYEQEVEYTGMSKERNRPLFNRQLSTLLLFLTFAGGITFGQEKPPSAERRRPLSPESASSTDERLQPPLSSPEEPVNCAVAGRYIDDAIARALQAKNTYLLVVIRPEDGEFSSKLNQLRLKQVKAYLEYTRLPKYTIAIGEKLKNTGRIEIYVEGGLLYTLPFHKNRGINLLSCVAV
jgi:hypothetical protein